MTIPAQAASTTFTAISEVPSDLPQSAAELCLFKTSYLGLSISDLGLRLQQENILKLVQVATK